MKKLLIAQVALLVANLTYADTLDFHFEDPVGDHTGIVDVVRMDFTFDNSTGGYTILLTAHEGSPFVGNFRINVNLFNPDTGTTAHNPSLFGDQMNDYDLSSPVSTIELTGTHPSLTQWKEGDRVAASGEPFGNPDYASGFGSSVGDLPGMSDADPIAYYEFTYVGSPSVPVGTGKTFYVPGDYSTLRAAILAAGSGDQIEVAPGTYYERIHFDGKGIRLYSSQGPAVTTIHGGGTGTVVHCNDSVGASTILEGFTITGAPTWIMHGGGMYNYYASPAVVNCIFSDNGSYHGGGMYNYNASPTVTDCTFTGNSATTGGGGMCNYVSSSPTVTRCTFTSNSASGNGGGMSNEFSSSPTVTRCTFKSNSASGEGGGMSNWISTSTVTNCTFETNTATTYGGGMSNWWSTSEITSCTFSGNAADSGDDICIRVSSAATITNSIVWGNGPENIYGPATVSYSAIEGGWSGEGNIDADPLFAAGSLHLSAGSPCIDAGTNSPAGGLPATDIEGNARCIDGNGDGGAVVDMGAFEYQKIGNTRPVAQAGQDQTVIVGDTLQIDASGSFDPDGDPLTYIWNLLTLPQGSNAEIAEPTESKTHFVADRVGVYTVSLIVNDGALDSEPATVTITAISLSDALVEILMWLQEVIVGLPADSFHNGNSADTLLNKLDALLEMVDEGAYEGTAGKLENDFLQKTDGCATNGLPDHNDWIVTCEAQAEVYPLVIMALEILERLI